MRFLLVFCLFLTACSDAPEAPSDDYVLIEFASKLEEDYIKLELNKESKKSESPASTEP